MPSADGSLRKRRILIVDDDPELVEVCSVILGMDGHVCHTALSGAHALSVLMEFEPEVVLLDLGLPDINGFDLAHAIRRRAPQILLIALTGWRLTDDQTLDPRCAVFDRCLEKPARAAALRSIVDEVDRSHRTVP